MNILIERKAKKPGIVFMFDEGDLLSLNRTLLQILRNVFQDYPRMCLVIAGTNKILDDISDVFSPVPRFFKKVVIGPFPSEDYIFQAISLPFNYAGKEMFKSEHLLLKGHFKRFNQNIIDLARRMPMEINLLCHYAYNFAADNFKKKESVVELYFNVDRKLLDMTIEQLRGSFGYKDFISSLTDDEISCMQILSGSMMPMSLNEMSVLMTLNKIDQGLIDMPIGDICGRISGDIFRYDQNIEKIIESISEKSSSYSIDVISKTILDRPLYATNDEWITSYFKLGWAKRNFDLDKGFIPTLGGVQMFRNPVSSMIHSIFFLKKHEALRDSSTFRARSVQGTSKGFRFSKKRQYLIVDYNRIADSLPYYYILNMIFDYDLSETKGEMLRLMKALREKNVISKYSVAIGKSME
jgi:hypothetical protein